MPDAEWLKHRAAVLAWRCQHGDCVLHDIGLTPVLCPFVTTTDDYLVGPVKKPDCGTVTAVQWEKEIDHAEMPVQKSSRNLRPAARNPVRQSQKWCRLPGLRSVSP